ncbi:ABC transporter permease [Nocardioides sp. LS1]|uniref:ABC transporter permease n=1 Tax=Nocardioides sp. LS1 TaxID=1027620 RepID=UPI000FF9526B|nr:ABC transporter permease [Nocardioides sp. LS1]GCD90164.1 sugar ABC transporter permease [Nocardioides sp. LS1]
MTMTSDSVEQQPSPAKAQPDNDPRRRRKFNAGFDRFSGIWILGLLVVLFGIWVPDTFLQTSTPQTILADQSVTGILCFGLILSVATGAFDLSIASTMGLSSCVVILLQQDGWNPVLASVVAILCGALVGLVNGLVVVKLGIDSFIATLGMSSVLVAATYWVTDGLVLFEGISPGFTDFGTQRWMGISLPVFYMIVIGAVIWLFLDFRPAGRMLYAVGRNPQAARLAGVRVDRVIFLTLIASATIAGFAGVVLAAKLGVGNPTSGPPYLLPVFTAVFLGATQIDRGGRANVLGTLVAIYLLATGVKGLQLAGAPSYVNDLFNGVSLIVALALALRKRRVA